MSDLLAGGESPLHLNPIRYISGCNTPAETTRAQLIHNVQRDIPWLETEPLKDKPLVIVAGGPSLKYRWPEIWSHDAHVMALNNAYPFLMEQGITPDYFMLLDARRENVDFLRRASLFTRHYIAAQCHPDVFDALRQHDTRLYLTILPESLELTENINKPKHRIAGCVGTVGIKALCMAYALGYRELHLYGYDSSYEGDAHHGFEQKLNDAAKTIEIFLEGKRYVTTPTLSHQVAEFCQMAGDMTRAHGFDINLHCDGLLPHMVAVSNARGDIPLAIREADKYRQMWEHDAYRKTAPGLFHVEQAIEQLGLKAGDGVIDFGCGSGKGAQELSNRGYQVTGVDFADNCRDADCTFPLVVACLWDLPSMFQPFGFCTDVMEHIPTEKVEAVLSNIARSTDSVYFNIATCDDAMGKGYKLHMTVMTAENWEKVLRRYWKDVTVYAAEESAVFVVHQPLDEVTNGKS